MSAKILVTVQHMFGEILQLKHKINEQREKII